MRIVTYRSGKSDRAGVETERGVVDAGSLLGKDPLSVRELLVQDRLGELAAADADGAEPLAADAIRRRPPVPDPDKIVCIGLNYRSHAEEAGIDPPAAPTIFAKFRNALAAAGDEIALPRASEKVDYEAEIAFVIGRRAKEVSADAALDHVAGYTLLNDLSARDLQFATPQWMPGKVFDGSAPCGPALVTPGEAGAHDAIDFKLELNGEMMQDASTSDLIFSVPELIAHLSSWMTLEPGDIVATGTPSGVGSVRKPRVWLQPGDEIAISSPTLGRLETRLRAA
ncbi:MAG TPA: fumarylacetoacetate hydrolase family protein [Solirubrobacterales bacterium]|nr:fumarylacetoacetate hydrolase family protein [Solirubrobacterales bacterium]